MSPIKASLELHAAASLKAKHLWRSWPGRFKARAGCGRTVVVGLWRGLDINECRDEIGTTLTWWRRRGTKGTRTCRE